MNYRKQKHASVNYSLFVTRTQSEPVRALSISLKKHLSINSCAYVSVFLYVCVCASVDVIRRLMWVGIN